MRSLIYALATLVPLVVAPAAAQAEPVGEPLTTLRMAAQLRNIPIGASVDENALRDDADYAAVLVREFSVLTPENSMKFDAVHARPFRYSFDAGDKVLAFAEEHRMEVHGHVLVWHEQLPNWLTKAQWTPEKLRTVLREHIYRVVGHYRGRIKAWDVVSEAIDDNGEMRKTFWLEGLGPEYVALAFQWAHEADPNAQLIYNDYGAEGGGRKSDAIFRLMQDLRTRGVPVHGVGLQAHLSVDEVPNPQEVRANMERLQALGLMVYITEMDVSLKLPVTPTKLDEQALVYRDMMNTCLSAPNCKGFTLWGFTDRYSWIPEFFPGRGAALVFDEQMQPKPSYRALIEVLAGH